MLNEGPSALTDIRPYGHKMQLSLSSTDPGHVTKHKKLIVYLRALPMMLCGYICVYLYLPPVAHMGESSRRVLVILDFLRIVQLQIQKDVPIPEAGSLACLV
jgi:hypothetical protein